MIILRFISISDLKVELLNLCRNDSIGLQVVGFSGMCVSCIFTHNYLLSNSHTVKGGMWWHNGLIGCLLSGT